VKKCYPFRESNPAISWEKGPLAWKWWMMAWLSVWMQNFLLGVDRKLECRNLLTSILSSILFNFPQFHFPVTIARSDILSFLLRLSPHFLIAIPDLNILASRNKNTRMTLPTLPIDSCQSLIEHTDCEAKSLKSLLLGTHTTQLYCKNNNT